MTIISDRDYNSIGDGLLRVKKPGNINSTINVSSIDGDFVPGSDPGMLAATNMSTIASLTGSRPKQSTLLLNNMTANLPSFAPAMSRQQQINPYSSLSPSRLRSHRPQYVGGKRVSVGSSSLLNTSSLIHYN